jgi:hypothetical protein
MRPRFQRRLGVLVAVLLSAALATLTAQQPTQKTPPPAPKAKKNPLLKLIEPWPTAEALAKRRADAEALPLFSSAEPLQLTIAADFKAINKDRDPKSRTLYPATLKVNAEDGAIRDLPLKIRARGHSRRMARTCDYVPLRLEFQDKLLARGTVFARQEALKLVVQCAGGGDYRQYLLREYLAYKIFNLVTPERSFRVRLATIHYVDKAGKSTGTRHGMLLEDEGDVAKRMEGRIVELPRLQFKDVEMDTLMPMMIFEYMIGNTDYSIYALHNVRIVQRPDKSLHPIPYDLDYSGLVNTPYARPARGILIKSVTERVYRGPCKRPEQIDPYVANFNAKKDLIKALPDSIPGLDRTSKDDTKSYIDSFFSSIKSPRDAKRVFVDCADKALM